MYLGSCIPLYIFVVIFNLELIGIGLGRVFVECFGALYIFYQVKKNIENKNENLNFYKIWNGFSSEIF